ncbi:filamentous hemagglutinin N-terminal domain-containing protein [Spirulina sp. CS-785/01]|uniref:two-partner secretion domain-containing protein n=1 Tax=Spirulina sp. CS-785/01 TaxID=3021716 RepID=UPI00232AD64E|nr:filamentous hemagglutinin N-terminal domain-containing protein [Spirulina sp. CS-785/01]MDB9314650.1 filamentous hemagglutinin N-terminal domain-containing protein [Spirulina sp. CS-785/01]
MSGRFSLALVFMGLLGLPVLPVQAQLVPDATLGDESSVVIPVEEFRQRIEGGATRGANLFHSFQEFNVGENRSVYFANPNAIHNILTRVTGGNPSDILGQLGVSGEANLWLINPNGIYFGPDASLDIRGSFVATTADGVELGDTGYFSAVDVDGSQLLAVEPGALFSNALAAHQRKINNRGVLTVGGDFVLDAGQLDLQGELQAEGDLTLRALDTVKIRDSVERPFIAAAGGELLVQGNESVDIFALSHPDSGLASGGDMVLRSGNAVGGDAHYYSGGSFRIEQINTTLGDLQSPNDPVIRASGDVSFANYTGTSLHILAGGSVRVTGDITITGADNINGLTETINLSNGSTVNINGKSQPTLDIRAGTTNFGGFGIIPTTATGFTTSSPNLSISGNTGNIQTQNININLPNSLIFISNNYRPNSNNGNISIGSISTSNTGKSGSVIIDSRDSINLTNDAGINTTSSLGKTGDILLLAHQDIVLGENTILDNSTFGNGEGGNLTLSAQNIQLNRNAKIIANTNGAGNAGLISINAVDSLLFKQDTTILNQVGLSATGGSNGININSEIMKFNNGTQINANVQGLGDSGDITIQTNDLFLDGDRSGIFNQVEINGTGNSGRIEVKAQNFSLSRGANINTNVRGSGNTGNILIDTDLFSMRDNRTGIFSQVENKAEGNSGDIRIRANHFLMSNSSQINADTNGLGNAGSIIVDAQSIQLLGEQTAIVSQVANQAMGAGGLIEIQSNSLGIKEGAIISSSTFGNGNSGLILVDANVIELSGEKTSILSQVGLNGQGDSGGIQITAESILLDNKGQINTNVLGLGQAGSISIESDRLILSRGSAIFSQVEQYGLGNSGQVWIDSNIVLMRDGSQINTNVRGSGNAGLVQFLAKNVTLSGFNTGILSQVEQNATGTGGAIAFEVQNLLLENGAFVTTSTFGEGNAGQIKVNANSVILNSFPSGIVSQVGTGAIGNGGIINIKTNNLFIFEGAGISVNTFGTGNAGTVNIEALESVNILSHGLISANSNSSGHAGNVKVSTNQLSLRNNGLLSVNGLQSGNPGNIQIFANSIFLNEGKIQAITNSGENANINLKVRDSIIMRFNSEIATEARGTGNGGNITFDVGKFILAIPSENSDIVANAFEGTGGQIIGQASGIFGFRMFEEVRTPESDFTASSAFGVDGIVDIKDRYNEPIPLPTNFLEHPINESTCALQDGRIAGGSSFTVSGRGGMPPSPNDPLTPTPYVPTWANQTGETPPPAVVEPETKTQAKPDNATIRPAQGWFMTADGTVHLTTEAVTPTASSEFWRHPDCRAVSES